MKRKLWFLIICVMFSCSVYAQDLSNYPQMYLSKGKINAIVVVDDKSPASYVIAQSGIALSLNSIGELQQQGIAKLASEALPIKENTISIGNPCENKVSAAILRTTDDCMKGFEAGKAKIIIILDTNTKLTHIVAAGYTQKGTIQAANMLKDGSKKKLNKESIIEIKIDEPIEVFQEKKEEEAHEIAKEIKEEQITQSNKTNGEEAIEIQKQESQPASIQQEAPKQGVFIRFFKWLSSIFG